MCKSKEQGGQRCETGSVYAVHHNRLMANKRYHARNGHEEKAQEFEQKADLLKQAKEQFGSHVRPFDFPVNSYVSALLDDIESAGFTPLIVGGSVRDVFTGKESKDIDIEVYGGKFEDVAKALKKKGYRLDEVGKSFGVMKTRLKNSDDIDISLPRTEIKSGEGHKGFEVKTNESMTVEEASSRRDFTFNAMMYSHSKRSLIDPHNGQEDFKSKTLQHISEAFADDPLRVMRGFQFASRFNMSMSPETIQLSQQLYSEASSLSEERMRTEWEKFYQKGQHPSQGMMVLSQTGWDRCYTGLQEANNPRLHNDLDKAAKLAHRLSGDRKETILAATIASHMKNSSDQDVFTARTSTTLKKGKMAYGLAQAVHQRTPQTKEEAMILARDLEHKKATIQDLLIVKQARGDNTKKFAQLAKELNIETRPVPALVTGGELMSYLDKKPGPWLGKLHRETIKAQDEGLLSTKEEALSWAKNKLNNIDM